MTPYFDLKRPWSFRVWPSKIAVSIWALGVHMDTQPLLTYLKLWAPELSVLSELKITWRKWHNDVLPQQTLMSFLDFMYSVTNHIACFIRASTLAHLGLERLALGWWQCARSLSVGNAGNGTNLLREVGAQYSIVSKGDDLVKWSWESHSKMIRYWYTFISVYI